MAAAAYALAAALPVHRRRAHNLAGVAVVRLACGSQDSELEMKQDKIDPCEQILTVKSGHRGSQEVLAPGIVSECCKSHVSDANQIS